MNEIISSSNVGMKKRFAKKKFAEARQDWPCTLPTWFNRIRSMLWQTVRHDEDGLELSLMTVFLSFAWLADRLETRKGPNLQVSVDKVLHIHRIGCA